MDSLRVFETLNLWDFEILNSQKFSDPYHLSVLKSAKKLQKSAKKRKNCVKVVQRSDKKVKGKSSKSTKKYYRVQKNAKSPKKCCKVLKSVKKDENC